MRSIKFGYPHHGMPAWGEVLTDAEIDSLASFLMYEEERLGIIKPPIPDTLETQDYMIKVDVIAEGLDVPWAIDFIGPNRALITERTGRLRIMENEVLLPDAVEGIPEVRALGQGGLLDVAIDPNYDREPWIYLAFSHGHGTVMEDGEERVPSMTSIVRAKLVGNTWSNQEVLFEAPHETYKTAGHHLVAVLSLTQKAISTLVLETVALQKMPKILAYLMAKYIASIKMVAFQKRILFIIHPVQ